MKRPILCSQRAFDQWGLHRGLKESIFDNEDFEVSILKCLELKLPQTP